MKKLYIKFIIVLIVVLNTFSGGVIYGQDYNCWSPFSFNPVPALCKYSGTTLTLNNPYHVPITSINWYQYNLSTSNQNCPNLATLNGWSLVQSGGQDLLTNPLPQSTCFAVVVNTGCCEYRNSIKVCVYEPLNTASISTIPSNGFPPLQQIPGYDGYRACNQWKGQIKLNYDIACDGSSSNSVGWTGTITDSDGTTTPANINIITTLLLNPGTLNVPSNMCWRKYHFVATITNVCGTQDFPIDIYIDRTTSPTDLTLSGTVWNVGWNPPSNPSILGGSEGICFGQSAVISANVPCKKENEGGIKIESWSVLPPSGSWQLLTGQPWTLFTNSLETAGIWKYKVQFRNGACPICENFYEIRVKPPLDVPITTNSFCVSQPPQITILSTTLSSGVSYSWYYNGELISGASSYQYNVPDSGAGYYYVVVEDLVCQVKKKSSPIKICSLPVVVIDGPCGLCKGQSIILKALVTATPSDCAGNCTFHWAGPNFFSSTDQNIQVSEPGEYKVKVKCGLCTSFATINVQFCPDVN